MHDDTKLLPDQKLLDDVLICDHEDVFVIFVTGSETDIAKVRFLLESKSNVTIKIYIIVVTFAAYNLFEDHKSIWCGTAPGDGGGTDPAPCLVISDMDLTSLRPSE